MTLFRLDDRLEKDAVDIGGSGNCRLRLMNDARWPWFILAPMMTHVEKAGASAA